MEGNKVLIITNDSSRYFLTNSFEKCDEALEEVVESILPCYAYVDNDDKTAMKYFVYKTFHLYKHAKERKVTGLPYVNHPLKVATILGAERVDEQHENYRITGDLITIVAALGHDGPEEFYDAKIRKRVYELAQKDVERKQLLEQRLEQGKKKTSQTWKKNKTQMLEELAATKRRLKRVKGHVDSEFERQEEMIHQEYLMNMQQNLIQELSELISPEKARYYVEHALAAMKLVTRRQNELYYDSVKKVFISDDDSLSRRDRKRAAIIKFADCMANTLELERSNGSDFQGRILYQQIIDVYEKNKDDQKQLRTELRRLERTAQTFSMHKKRYKPGEFKPYEKLYRCYKNIILVNEYRIYKNKNGEIPEISNIQLLQETISVLDSVLAELCSYYTKPHAGRGQMSFDKIYDLYQENEMYKQSGGYNGVTDPEEKGSKPSSFDGILKFFFDTRVHGDPEPLEKLYRNKEELFRVTLGLRTLAETYKKERMFVLQGFDRIKDHR